MTKIVKITNTIAWFEGIAEAVETKLDRQQDELVQLSVRIRDSKSQLDRLRGAIQRARSRGDVEMTVEA
jgi:hypothetical protein